MVALVDGQPRLLNLKQILSEFLRHRREVVTRRTLFRLKKARHEGHIAEGKAGGFVEIDEMIELIKTSADAPKRKCAWHALGAHHWWKMLGRTDLDLSMARPEGWPANLGCRAKVII